MVCEVLQKHRNGMLEVLKKQDRMIYIAKSYF